MDTETFFGGASDPRNNYQLSNYLDQGREYLPGLLDAFHNYFDVENWLQNDVTMKDRAYQEKNNPFFKDLSSWDENIYMIGKIVKGYDRKGKQNNVESIPVYYDFMQ